MPRRTKEDAEKTRAGITRSALRIFAQRGYAATRLDDVAVDAGITRGAVYFHFRDKADLYRAALEGPSVLIANAMEAALTAELPADERLAKWFDDVFALAESNEEVRAALEIQWLRTEALVEFDSDMEMKRKQSGALAERLAELIQNGIAEGRFHSTSPAVAVATGLLALMTGLLQGWLLDRRIPLRRYGSAAVSTYLNGMRT